MYGSPDRSFFYIQSVTPSILGNELIKLSCFCGSAYIRFPLQKTMRLWLNLDDAYIVWKILLCEKLVVKLMKNHYGILLCVLALRNNLPGQTKAYFDRVL